MTRSELIHAISERTKIPMNKVEPTLYAFIDIVTEQLVTGDRVQLPGFCTFETKVKEEREAFNPARQCRTIYPRKVLPVIKPGKTLKEAVNKENEA